MISVNGTPIATPKKFVPGIYDVSKNADRNAAGTMLIDRVAVKHKLEMEWGPLTNSEMSTLLTSVSDVFFTVTYPDPKTGSSNTITCYVGDRSAAMYKYTGTTPMWEGLKMNFIEQ